MALHPFREALGRAGLHAFHNESSFKPQAEAALDRFRSFRADLERQVKRGDLTVKVARAQAEAAAQRLKLDLGKQAEGFSPISRTFLDRLVEAGNARKRAKEYLTPEGLQRETNRLLRLTLIEQQLQNRAGEFEGKTFVRAMPGSQPAPTLPSLLAFHETATQAGDDAAREWARRQLESIRTRLMDPSDIRRVDLACDRPESVNPRLVASYLEAVRAAEPGEDERFVHHALESRDANACVAAFILARESPAGVAARWVRDVLDGLPHYPEAALETLRTLEAEARGADSEAAKAQVDYAVAVAESQVRFSDVEVPTEADIARQDRIRSKPVARLGQPIGLALERRGFDPEAIETSFGSSDGEASE